MRTLQTYMTETQTQTYGPHSSAFHRGTNGNDVLSDSDGLTRRGSDYIDAGNGNDTITDTFGNNTLIGGRGRDILFTGNGQDTLDGGAGRDYLYAGGGDDFLSGGAGADLLNAGSGNDRLIGGAGNDRLFGGQGQDSFIFADGFGRDVINDFKEEDTIDFSDFSGANTFEDVLANATQTGRHTVIDFGEGNSIKLRNTDIEQLDEDDFQFEDAQTFYL